MDPSGRRLAAETGTQTLGLVFQVRTLVFDMAVFPNRDSILEISLTKSKTRLAPSVMSFRS
jgi:hypothetical protein